MNRILAAAFLAALAAPAFATEPPVIVVEADAWKRWADDFSRDLRTSMGMAFSQRLGPQKVVKGAPYSAEVVTEMKQTLADGNVIARKSTGAVYRDGEGRMRQESGGDGKAPNVFILDPVAGKHYVVSANGRAHAMSLPMPGDGGRRDRQIVSVDGTQIRIEDGKVFVNGKEAAPGRVETVAAGKTIVVENGRISIDGKDLSAPRTPPTPGAAADRNRHVIVKRVEGADGVEREEVRVQVIRPDGDMAFPPPPVPPVPPVPGAAPVPPVPPVPPMPGVQTMRFESTARLGKGVTTALGFKEFDGVKAEGKSTVWTIPAGQIGNVNPIQVTSETWTSPDLQVTVYSRYNDPRTGESTYRLANVKRGEPPAELFKVPEEALVKSKAKAKG